ncbi:PQQ-binding-like beta-propeller repeat protein [Vallitalea guaymasensis]|uniref:outer membrane protein assembly factor BamB family protein n=1 Tax=Vallitalea guaymasensis TaxID=1185412 RepID=UPI002354D17A|nr:PQQ-binding-like beta-propeller repeat protein [Vallitalea guaymasensis]
MKEHYEMRKNDKVTVGRFFSFKTLLQDDNRIDMSRSYGAERSSEKFLSAGYSCKLMSGMGMSGRLSTIDFDIPKSYSNNVLVFFSLFANEIPTSNNFVVGIEFDGQPALIEWVDLIECNKWLNQKSASFPIPTGAKKARIFLELPPVYRASNSAYIDNVGIYFDEPYVDKPKQYAIFSDTDGAITAHNIENGEEEWTFETDNGFLTAKPVVVDDVVYFGDGNTTCCLYALYTDSGIVKWKYKMEGSIDATPEVFDSKVYISTSKGFLYAIDKETGKKIERYDILHLQPGKDMKIYSNVLSDNIIYLTSDKGFYAFDIATKVVISSFDLDYPVKGVPAILNYVAYYGDVKGSVYAMDIINNQCRWRKTFNMPIHSSPLISGNYLIVGCDNGSLYVLDLKDGEVQSECSIEGHPVRSYTLASNQLFVTFNNIDADIYAFDIRYDMPSSMLEEDMTNYTNIDIKTIDGTNPFKFTWKYNITNGVERDPMIIGNRVCFAASDGFCYCLDKDDGSVIWKDIVTTPNFTSPVLAPLNKHLCVSRRYDQYCYLMSHNSFAYFLDGWWIGNQELTLTEQLNYGVRGLMLDIYKEKINGVDQIVMYHGTKWSSYSWLFLDDAMKEIGIWLKNNPTEVVTIQFENRVFDPKLVQKAFDDGGVSDMIFYADRVNTGESGYSWEPVLKKGWPSIGWMVENDKRLVVFAEKKGDGLPYVWDYTVETKYGEDSLKGNYDERDESDSIPLSKNRSLYTVNNFPTIWYLNILKLRTYKSINGFNTLIARCNTCKFNPRFFEDEKLGWEHHLPNFLAVDFVTRGADGGPLRAVEEINKYWEEKIKKQEEYYV